MVETARKFKYGWFGDGGLGERMIQAIVSGRKTATSCPAYDPEDADVKVGDRLELTDKRGQVRAALIVTSVEVRPFAGFDEALASREGTTLGELKESHRFANGREIRPNEEMRVIYFQLADPKVKL